MIFLILFIIPLIIIFGSWIFLKGITVKELITQLAVQVVVTLVSVFVISFSNTADTEILNGYVVNKSKDRVSCTHSYSCPPCHEECSGTGKDKSCHEVCSTCYDHDYDYDWNVLTSIGTFEIDRVDRQGVIAPSRWDVVRVGDPVSKTHNYKNYIKASPNSLFRHNESGDFKYKGTIPDYPDNIYDYYKIDRLVSSIPTNKALWNEGLSQVNSELGAKKQVNILVVLTHYPQDWYNVLEASWIGGKKNDVVLVIGVDTATNKASWAQVMCWTTAKIFEVKLRDDILNLNTIEPKGVLNVLREDVDKYYIRKPMKDFEYLAATITPSTTQLVISILIGSIIAIMLTIFFNKEDIFNEESSFKSRNYPFKSRRY